MNTKKLLIVIVVFAALLLTACQLNFKTEILKDGSGTYIQEIGFQGDEASMAGLSTGDEEFCASQNSELLPGTTIRQETRNEDETWCIYETPFSSLDALEAIYGMTDTRINNLSQVDGVMIYDITLDLSGDSGAPMGAEVYWMVTMPGSISEHNATSEDGNTLTWKLILGQENDIRATSQVGGINFDDKTILYVLGGGAILCLCCLLPLVIAGVAFFFIRRKKQADVDTMVDTGVS